MKRACKTYYNHVIIYKKSFIVLCFAALIAMSSCKKKEIYVSPDGDDANPGTVEEPFATLSKAKNEARKINSSAEIILREGTYYLTESVIFDAQDSRDEKAPLSIKPFEGENVVISGAETLKLKWQEYKDGIWMAKVEKKLIFDQFYINGVAQRMARYPNFDPEAKIFGGVSPNVIDTERVATWEDPTGGYVHTIHPMEWGSYHYLIKGKNEDNTLVLERKASRGGRGSDPKNPPMHPDSRFVENIFEELDTVNEWYFNPKTKTLYYYPEDQSVLSEGLLEFPQLQTLVEFVGTEESPIQNINFDGITFTKTLRTFENTSERMSRGDWYIYRGGAFFMEGTENCTVENCTFSELGGNAVFVNSYNRNVEVRSSLFERLGASAVCFCGNADSRYPFETPIDSMVLHPGPKTNNYPAKCIVFDNLMHDLGFIEKQVAGVHISMAEGITVSQNTIYDVPRAGINVNDGMWGGHLIEYNDVFNTVLETADHGAFNSWGRDHDYFRDYKLSLIERDRTTHLDMLTPIVIRNNRFRCDHGWDIDLDDGSSHYEIYNNLLLAGGLKLREGFFRTVENNIMINNSLHPHVWYPNSDDVFTMNICTTPYYPIRMPDPWTKYIDRNIFLDSVGLENSKVDTRDKNSIYVEPDFVDSDAGDYTLKENSPALAFGFENFDMHSFGVVSERLKKQAKTPPLPKLIRFVKNENDVINLMGMTLKNVGVGERSAVAMFAEKGVFIVDIDPESKFYGTLNVGEVILKYHTKEVNNLRNLQEAILVPNWNETLNITIFRRGRGTSEISIKK
jgi:hypothetical protein